MRFLVLSLVLLLSFTSVPVSADAGVAVTLTTTVIGSEGGSNGGSTYYGGGYRYIEPVREIQGFGSSTSGSSYIPTPAPPVYISPPVGTTVYSSTGSSTQQDTLPSTFINENFKWGEFWVVIFWAVMAGCTIAVVYYVRRRKQEKRVR